MVDMAYIPVENGRGTIHSNSYHSDTNLPDLRRGEVAMASHTTFVM